MDLEKILKSLQFEVVQVMVKPSDPESIHVPVYNGELVPCSLGGYKVIDREDNATVFIHLDDVYAVTLRFNGNRPTICIRESN